MIERRGDVRSVAERIVSAGEEYGAEAYVLGLPLNMDGSLGKQGKLTRDFGILLGRTTGRAVHEWDERLSSHAADEYLTTMASTRKKRRARRDALAAQVILQSFLDASAGGIGEEPAAG